MCVTNRSDRGLSEWKKQYSFNFVIISGNDFFTLTVFREAQRSVSSLSTACIFDDASSAPAEERWKILRVLVFDQQNIDILLENWRFPVIIDWHLNWKVRIRSAILALPIQFTLAPVEGASTQYSHGCGIVSPVWSNFWPTPSLMRLSSSAHAKTSRAHPMDLLTLFWENLWAN